jgi:membrane fusion protein (multidrug efflux system)
MLWIALLVAAVVVLLLVIRPWQGVPVAEATELVTAGPASRVLAINGHISAKRSVAVRSTVAGRVLEVLVDEGDAVTAGQPIARLDTSQPQTLVAQARAALDSGMTKLQQAQVNAARARALGTNISRNALEDAELALIAATNESDRLKAALDEAENALSQYQINAPLSGTVLTRSIDAGQVVDAQTPIFTIANLNELVVETDVDELYSAQIRVGQKVLLQPAGVLSTITGKVTFVSPVIEPTTAGRAIEISFDKAISLPIGLTVAANIVVDEQSSVITIPRAAIVRAGNDQVVYVVKDGKALRRVVSVIDWPADRVIVTTGLSAGDVVAVSPAGLSEGQTVKTFSR